MKKKYTYISILALLTLSILFQSSMFYKFLIKLQNGYFYYCKANINKTIDINYRYFETYGLIVNKSYKYKVVTLGNTQCASCFKKIRDADEEFKKFDNIQIIHILIGDRNEYLSYFLKEQVRDEIILLDKNNNFIIGNNIDAGKKQIVLDSKNELKYIGYNAKKYLELFNQ